MFRCANLKRRLEHAAPHPVSWLESRSGFVTRSALLVLMSRVQGLNRGHSRGSVRPRGGQ